MTKSESPLLSVQDLKVQFGRKADLTTAVDEVSFDLYAGEHLGLVGESGSGKSVTSLAIMGLLPRTSARVSGRVDFEGKDLLTVSPRTLRNMRGRDVAMVFQDPMTSLNPVITVGKQLTEIFDAHGRGGRRGDAKRRAAELLERVSIPEPGRRLTEYPHQLSGGMRQRVLIAMALANDPRLLIADEPTTALDVTIQAQILEILKEAVADSGTALIMITHDLGVVAGLCDRVNVMYQGRIVETANRNDLFADPRHPYTHGLIGSVPRLDSPRGEPLMPIPGSPTDVLSWADGCAFAPRCPVAESDCREGAPSLERGESRSLRCFHPMTTDARERSRA